MIGFFERDFSDLSPKLSFQNKAYSSAASVYDCFASSTFLSCRYLFPTSYSRMLEASKCLLIHHFSLSSFLTILARSLFLNSLHVSSISRNFSSCVFAKLKKECSSKLTRFIKAMLKSSPTDKSNSFFSFISKIAVTKFLVFIFRLLGIKNEAQNSKNFVVSL